MRNALDDNPAKPAWRGAFYLLSGSAGKLRSSYYRAGKRRFELQIDARKGASTSNADGVECEYGHLSELSRGKVIFVFGKAYRIIVSLVGIGVLTLVVERDDKGDYLYPHLLLSPRLAFFQRKLRFATKSRRNHWLHRLRKTKKRIRRAS